MLLHEKRPYHDGSFPDDLGQWSEKPSLARPFHYTDGVTIWMAPVDLSPDDDFLGQRSGLEPDGVDDDSESDEDEGA